MLHHWVILKEHRGIKMLETSHPVMWCHVAEKGVLIHATMKTLKTYLISAVVIYWYSCPTSL